MGEIIKKIILFLMASSVIIQLVSEESYKKCMRLFVGLVFLVFILSTVFKGTDLLNDMESALKDISDSFNSKEEYESIFNEYYGN